WTRKSGTTPSGSTGPSEAESGTHYIFVESSSRNHPDVRFVLQSANFSSGSSDRALYFQCSMYGSSMGSLALEFASTAGWTQLWEKSGDKGAGWFPVAVTIPGEATALRFVGITGSSYRSDMALDSIVASEMAPTPPPPMPVDQALSCDFESDFCNWLFKNVGEEEWRRKSGNTPSSNTGPSSAYTGTYYVYTEASGGNKNKQFVLESPTFAISSSRKKISFWYHMKGSKMGDLKVMSSVYPGTGAAWNTIFADSGSQGDQWIHAEVEIPGDVNKLRIVGETGNGWSSDIAVDDITVV
ncbi:unnamed protein product, partial [Symbiodinium necroappetens]